MNVGLYSDNEQDLAYNSAVVLHLDDYFCLCYIQNRLNRRDKKSTNPFHDLEELELFFQRLEQIEQRNTLNLIEGAYYLDLPTQKNIMQLDQENRAIAQRLMPFVDYDSIKTTKHRIKTSIQKTKEHSRKCSQQIFDFAQKKDKGMFYLIQIADDILNYKIFIQKTQEMLDKKDHAGLCKELGVVLKKISRMIYQYSNGFMKRNIKRKEFNSMKSCIIF